MNIVGVGHFSKPPTARYLVTSSRLPVMETPATIYFNPTEMQRHQLKGSWPTKDPANSVAHYRKGIITQSGMIGLSNLGVNIGDVVYVLLGGKVPLILRRNESSSSAEEGEFCEYVTHAYAHGIMDGQVMNEGREPGWISLV